jgi:hypothetical protein
LGVARDVMLALALEAWHAAVECGHELEQVVHERLV